MSNEEELVKLVHGKLRKSKGDDMSTEVTSKMSKKRRGVNEEGKEAAEPQKSTEKDVKKRKHVGDEGNSEPGTERKNKRRREHEASLNESKSKSIRVGDENLKAEGRLKKLKNRKNPEHDRIAEAGQLGEPEGSAKTERKKKKTRDKDGESIKKIRCKNGCKDLPDPEDDTSLASQARKGAYLSYLHHDSLRIHHFQRSYTHTSNLMTQQVGSSTKPGRIGLSETHGRTKR